MVVDTPDTSGLQINMTEVGARKDVASNVVVESLNSLVLDKDKKKKKEKELQKVKNLAKAIKDKLAGKVDPKDLDDLAAEAEKSGDSKIEEITKKLEKKTEDVTKSLEAAGQTQVVNERVKELETAQTKELASRLLGEDIAEADTQKVKRIDAELSARLEAARKVRDILGVKPTDEENKLREELAADTNIDQKRLERKLKLLDAIDIDIPDDRDVSYTNLINEVKTKNTNLKDPDVRREALRVSSIIDETRRLEALRKSDKKDDRTNRLRESVVNDLSALSSDDEVLKTKRTGKYLEKLRTMSGKAQIRATETGGYDFTEYLDGDTQINSHIEEITEILKIPEVKESFRKTSDEVTVTNLTLRVIEFDMRRKLQEAKTIPDGENLISNNEIKKSVIEMFPLNTALAVEAASNPGDKKKQKELQEYMLRRSILETTLQNYRDKIESNIRRYQESRINPESESTSRLMERLTSRKGRAELQKSDEQEKIDPKKVKQFITNGGNTILVTSDIDQMLHLAPDLFSRDGKKLSREEIKSYIENDENIWGEKSFQMAVKLEANKEREEKEETVLVVYREKDQEARDAVIPGEEYDKIRAFGFYLNENDNLTEDDVTTLISLSPTVVYHEQTHGIIGDYITSKIQAINERIEQVESETGGSKVEQQARLAKVDLLNEIREKIVYEDVEKERWRAALEELAAKVEERTYIDLKEDIATEDELGIKLKLSDVYIFDPDKDPNLIEREVTPAVTERIRKNDEEIQYIVDMVNILVDPTKKELIQSKILEFNKQQGLNIDNPSVEQYLKYHILSYLHDGGDLQKLSENLEEILGDLNEAVRREAVYGSMDPKGEIGVISADKDSRLRDPVTIANNALKNSPLFPKALDGHLMAPLHYSIGIPGLDFVQKFARAGIRYHLFKPYYKELQETPFWKYWENVSSDPLKVAEKDKGEFFTPEILGAWVRQSALDGKNPDQILGQNQFDTKGDNFDKKRGTFKKIEKADTKKSIDTGIAGKAMAAWSRTPVLGWMFPRYHSAPWGMAMEKALGRGPVPRLIGRYLWGQSVLPNADPYQKIGFSSAPKWQILPGFKEDDSFRGEDGLEPDKQPGSLLYKEGNLTPHWTGDKWELAARIPVESVIPSMEYNRAASLRVMLAMMAKSGMDEQALRFMITKYVQELNLGQREGIPGYDIGEFKDPLREGDLHYTRRLRANRYTIAKYENQVKELLFGAADADGELHDFNGLDDSEVFRRKLYESEEEGNGANAAKAEITNLDRKLAQKIDSTEIIRGHVSEETLEEMIDLLNSYTERGFGRSSDEGKKVKDHPFMIRHVFRAMHHENAIRRLRTKYLTNDPNVSKTLHQWNKEIADKVKKNITDSFNDEVEVPDPNDPTRTILVPNTHKGESRLQAKQRAFDEYLAGKTLPIAQIPKELNSDQIMKLFVVRDSEGAPLSFVDNAESGENSAFGLGDLDKIAFNTEWNSDSKGAGKDRFTLGAGFTLHKLEVQAFQRAMQYWQAREIMKAGLPPDAINIPGETQMQERTLTSDLWSKKPSQPGEDFFYMNEADIDNLVKKGVKRDEIKGRDRIVEYRVGYFRKLKALAEGSQEYDTAQIPGLKDEVFKLFEPEGTTDDEKWASIEKIFNDDEEGFKQIVKFCDKDPNFMKKLFGNRAELQATFLNERNQLFTIKPAKPVTELIPRFFEQGAMVQETEEHMKRIEDQMSFYTLMRLYLMESRRAIPLSKARSEIFKKQAQYIKYFRWAILGYTAFVVLNSPAFLPTTLPLPFEVYATMVAMSYYESYYLAVKQKYWGMRELNAIKYSDEMSEFTNRLEQMLTRFEIPSDEEQEQYGALKSRYEKFFEGISDVDTEELSAKPNVATLFINKSVSGFLNS